MIPQRCEYGADPTVQCHPQCVIKALSPPTRLCIPSLACARLPLFGLELPGPDVLPGSQALFGFFFCRDGPGGMGTAGLLGALAFT